MSQEYLGTGWRYPVQFDDGEVVLSRYAEDVREAIWIILSTAPGERVMRPDFGCGIHEYVRFEVEEALTRWEPRIELDEVQVQSSPKDPARLLISIDYRVRATDSRFNLVYPFYLQRGESA